MANFALIGVAGFVAPRHLAAIQKTGNRLLAAADPSDSVGILDRYSFDVKFFREIERFDRFLDKQRRGAPEGRVHYVSICSPNYLHDAHVRLALRSQVDAICEKPLVLNPWNLDALEVLERETGRRVYTVLQLRVHPQLLALKSSLSLSTSDRPFVILTYVTARGGWYDVSWKGSEERSGGVVTNIGIHLFDLLIWLYGGVKSREVHLREPRRAAGSIELEGADVVWFLSIDRTDLQHAEAGSPAAHRSITVNGTEIEFSDGFSELHTRVYEETLGGRGFGIAEARPSIELVYRIRKDKIRRPSGHFHPIVAREVE